MPTVGRRGTMGKAGGGSSPPELKGAGFSSFLSLLALSPSLSSVLLWPSPKAVE